MVAFSRPSANRILIFLYCPALSFLHYQHRISVSFNSRSLLDVAKHSSLAELHDRISSVSAIQTENTNPASNHFPNMADLEHQNPAPTPLSRMARIKAATTQLLDILKPSPLYAAVTFRLVAVILLIVRLWGRLGCRWGLRSSILLLLFIFLDLAMIIISERFMNSLCVRWASRGRGDGARDLSILVSSMYTGWERVYCWRLWVCLVVKGVSKCCGLDLVGKLSMRDLYY